MLDTNKVVLVGRLTRDPELKTTSSGVNVTSFTLAVNRRFKDNTGKYPADFINCVAWRKEAEYLCNYGSKGQYATITGPIQTRSYQDKNGNKVFVTEVKADDISLDYQNDNQSQNNFDSYNHTQSSQSNHTAQNSNQNTNNNSSDPFAGSGDTLDIPADNLPF